MEPSACNGLVAVRGGAHRGEVQLIFWIFGSYISKFQ